MIVSCEIWVNRDRFMSVTHKQLNGIGISICLSCQFTTPLYIVSFEPIFLLYLQAIWYRLDFEGGLIIVSVKRSWKLKLHSHFVRHKIDSLDVESKDSSLCFRFDRQRLGEVNLQFKLKVQCGSKSWTGFGQLKKQLIVNL